MSTRGGYGFVINGKETIIYTGGASELDGLGNTLVQWLKTTNVEALKHAIENLAEVQASDPVNQTDISQITRQTGITPRNRFGSAITTWNDLLYLAQNDPDFLIDSGYFLDGSWIINSPDMEYLYLVNLDEQLLEIYHGFQPAHEAKGRFRQGKNSLDSEAGKPNLLAMYPLNNLPRDLNWLEENKYDLIPVWFKKTPSDYDTTGDPTFISPDLFGTI